jgi:calcineurin-like phosphoesterase family protein
MGQLYIISDPHFGHHNMAMRRGFNDAYDHDEHIVSQWNKIVTKRDTVWILGDITMEKGNYEILDRLNGIKKVVLGNHDMPQHIPKLLNHVNYVCGMFQYKRFIFSHAPIHPCEIKRFLYNVHGHVHENSIKRFFFWKDKRYINVCCEVVNYTPQLLSNYVRKK